MRIVPALPAVPKKGQGLCFSASVTASLGPAFTAVGQAAGLRAGRGETASEGPVGRAATGDGPEISDPAGSAASKSSSAARQHPATCRGTMPTGTRSKFSKVGDTAQTSEHGVRVSSDNVPHPQHQCAGRHSMRRVPRGQEGRGRRGLRGQPPGRACAVTRAWCAANESAIGGWPCHRLRCGCSWAQFACCKTAAAARQRARSSLRRV